MLPISIKEGGNNSLSGQDGRTFRYIGRMLKNKRARDLFTQIAMSQKQTVNEYQYNIASSILRQLHDSINPDFLGLVSSYGHPIISFASPDFEDYDALASLAASAYAATRQLAQLVSGTDFTMMFNEGEKLNVHIAQVSDNVLLVCCFRRVAELGKVRVLTNRALGALSDAMTRYENNSPGRGALRLDENAESVVAKLSSIEGEELYGSD